MFELSDYIKFAIVLPFVLFLAFLAYDEHIQSALIHALMIGVPIVAIIIFFHTRKPKQKQ